MPTQHMTPTKEAGPGLDSMPKPLHPLKLARDKRDIHRKLLEAKRINLSDYATLAQSPE